jgi:uncharacterized membrane protein YdcZ (DUF606 family)
MGMGDGLLYWDEVLGVVGGWSWVGGLVGRLVVVTNL